MHWGKVGSVSHTEAEGEAAIDPWSLFRAKVTLHRDREDSPVSPSLMKLPGNQITVHTGRWPKREQASVLFLDKVFKQ